MYKPRVKVSIIVGLTVAFGGAAAASADQFDLQLPGFELAESNSYQQYNDYEVSPDPSRSLLLAQDTGSARSSTQASGGQSGDTSLAEANKQFNNPLTRATLFIVENDTITTGGKIVDGHRRTNVTVVEPVIPVSLGDSGWSLVNRPILPIVVGGDVPDGVSANGKAAFDGKSGVGDLTFFSALSPDSKGKFSWGAGPVFRFPTASPDDLGSKKYSAGPMAVAVYGDEKFTLGLLNQNLFSFAGSSNRDSVNVSTLQYFAFYNFTPEWGIGAAPIISYDWDAKRSGDALSLPIGLGVTRTFKIGKAPARVLLEGQYYARQKDTFGPRSNIRLAFALFLPKLK